VFIKRLYTGLTILALLQEPVIIISVTVSRYHSFLHLKKKNPYLPTYPYFFWHVTGNRGIILFGLSYSNPDFDIYVFENTIAKRDECRFS
jgi:hypothetical protein